MGSSGHSVLAPALVQSRGLFTLTAALLSGLVFGPGQAWGQTTCSTTPTVLNFNTRAAAESWQNRPSEGVPTIYSATKVGASGYAATNSSANSLQTATVNGVQSLEWQNNFTSTSGSATVTFNFDRPVTNVNIRVQDIEGFYNPGVAGILLANGYIDQVTFTGALTTGGVTTAVTPTLTRANLTNTTFTDIIGNVARGKQAGGENTSANNATVIANYPTPVTSITLVVQNLTGAPTLNAQSIGIDNISWCRVAPSVANVTTAPVLSTATQAGIAGLSGTADGTLTYTIKSLPAGALFYNTTGTTYAAVALNQALTAAQAASLRYTPATGSTGASTSFTYSLSDDASPIQTTGNATYTIPLQYPVACAPGTATPFAFSNRPLGEDWTARTSGVAAPGTNATLVSVGNYTSGTTSSSSLQTGMLNGVNTLFWQNDYTTSSTNTSSVTFTFNRPLTNFTVKVQDIDVGPNFTDRVTFVGANGGTTVIPALTADNPGANIVAISGNVATGQVATSSTVDGTVTAYFGSPITSLTVTYANASTALDPANQGIGIDQLTWCEQAPTALDVTSATVLSSVGATSISTLASTVDSAPATYTLASIPTPAQGVLSYYNTTTSTYADITAANFAGLTLTAAQAASLRFAPAAGTSGSVTFTYKVKDGNNQTSANTATYTIPVSNAACATTASLNFRTTTPVPDDWKNHAALAVPTGSPATTIRSGGYTSPGTATSTLATVATANGLNGVQTLQWLTDYANTTDNTSTVTFTFNRPVSNYTLRVQDIDRAENAASQGVAANAFIDQVTFVGDNSGTTVLPSLAPLGAANTVNISGNVATGTSNITNLTDGTVTAYFATQVTSVTITYRNLSTFATDPTGNAIGLEEMTWCRLAPVANAVTTATVPSSSSQAIIAGLSGSADGTVTSYTITGLPANGTLLYNTTGTTYAAVALNQVLTPAQAASLRYTPNAGFTGASTTFAYTAQDDANATSIAATYTIPLQYIAPCTTGTTAFNFSTRPAEDWRTHTPLSVPATSTLTTISSGPYAPSPGTSTLEIAGVNGVTSLAWTIQYTSTSPGTGTTPGTDRTTSATFTFNRAVTNFTVRVQDIDVNNAGGSVFIDQVIFNGYNGTTLVTPVLTAANPGSGSVTINGNTATGRGFNTGNTTDGTVTASFASAITSLTLTYNNTSTGTNINTTQGIGIDNMSWCRQAPVAANITNPSRPSGQAAAAANSLSAASDGSIASYTITAVPPASQGIFYVNGQELNATNFPNLRLTPTQATQLSFAPAASFSGTAGFSYFATDDAGIVSNTATYGVPVTNTGAAGTPAACATPGKDGSPTLSTNPNTYYPATASAAAGTSSIVVGAGTRGSTPAAAATISKGDLLLVIQMQGADLNTSNNDTYGDGVAGGGASGNLATNFQAGTYEYVVANNATPIDVAAGGTITLTSALVNSYVSSAATSTDGPRRFQVVRIPQYGNLTLGGTLTALPWNGSVGGIIALDVAGQTNFSGNSIDASGRGFRGGGGRTQATAAGTNGDYVGTTTTNAHAQKGEGTAGTPRYVNVPTTTNDAATNATVDTNTDGYAGGSFSRGAPGNAGGGGNNNVNNSGGGGGANGGNGGRGGDNFGDNQAIGGEPGASFGPASSARLVLGGGGGAGSTNNSTGTPGTGFASSGAAGGGIVLLRTGTVSGTGTIVANGGSANNTVADDGSGGGGAGGSILLTANNPAGLTGLTLTANGGKGGTNTGASSGPHGPGGGGGGGVILTNASVASISATAGLNGATQGANPAFGSAAGVAGVTNTQISNAIAGSTVGTTCAADVATAITGPATLTPAQPSGTYTVTFANEGPAMAQSVTRTVTLPSGATNIFVNGAVYVPSVANTIDFGTAASLASGATSSFTFSFTPATTATGTQTITSNVATISGQGADSAPNSSAITATVPPVADVAATIVPGAAVPAGTLASATTPPSFTATFTNNGPANAMGVVASVQLPKGLTNVSASNGGVYDAATGLVSYSTITLLINGGSAVSVIKFDAPAAGPVMATAGLTTTTSQAGLTANDRQTAALVLTPSFDLATSLSGPATSVAGDLVTLALTTTNNGPGAASAVVQTAQLAIGLTNVYVSNGGYYNSGTATATVNYGGVSYSVPAGGVIYPPLASLPGGQTVANTVSFVMPGTAFAPSATVTPNTTAGGEKNPANNLAYLNGAASATTITVPAATGNPANVYTKISSSTATTTVGGAVTLTVTTGNNGSATSAGGSATGVVQTVQLLPGFAANALQVDNQTGTLSGNTITFSTSGATYNTLTGLLTFPAIAQASGASVSHTIGFVAPASTGNNGQLLATAMVTAANLDPVPTDNMAATAIALVPSTDLAATLTGPATATAGQVVSYTATFTNNGPMAAGGYNANGTQTAGVFASAQLPVGLGAVTVTNTAGMVITDATYNPLTGVVTFPALPADAVGATQAYTLSFVAPARSLVASALVSSASPDATPANNSASVSTTIAPAADLATSVSGPAMAAIGNPVTYTVATTNNGPNAATTVVPTLQLPTGFTAATLTVGGLTGTLNTTTGNIDYGTGANYSSYNTATGLVTFPSGNLASGSSALNRVTFLMPDAAGGQLAGVATATSATTDLSPGNNAGSVATSIAPATTATADLSSSITGTPSSAPTGTDITFKANFRNSGPAAATNVVPTLQLPAGLTIASIDNGGVYNPATGLVTWPTIASLASNAPLLTYTVVVKAPASGPVFAYSSVSSDTSEPNPSLATQPNNVGTTTVNVTPVFDVATRLGGPATAAAGTSQTYTATTINNGQSATNSATTQVVTLPTGVAPVTGSITGGGNYSSANNTITWTIAAGQLAGSAGAVANSFVLVQPAAGVALAASVSATGDSNLGNNTAALTTSVPNQVPMAAAVANALMPFIGNTAASSTTAIYGVLISPLVGTDPENALASSPYTIVALPDAAVQGTLYYGTGGSYTAAQAGQTLTAAEAATLRFLPQAGYVGNASFTYSVVDAAGNQSPAANYTIAVGSDLDAAYAKYNATKGGATPYVTGDVLAQFTDATAARYNSAGALYDAAGNQLGGTTNGISSAVITAGTLPAGVSLDPATGRIYVSNASQLVSYSSARDYTVTVATTDANGGVTTQPVTFTLGASAPLPVVLTDFTALAVRNRDAFLTWATASEKNNDHFDIERSFDGTAFAQIAAVAGHGTTTAASSYSLTDAGVAALANGPVYYRLRQVDRDGASSFSPVRSVRFSTEVAAAPIALSLFPNPAQATTQLDLRQLPATGTYQVVLLDATGRTVRTATLAGGLPQPLDVQQLASGTYHVRVSGQLADGSSFQQTLRFTKE